MKDGEGNNAIVEFESLELEEGAEEAPPSKLNKMLATLKEKLEPSDYAAVLSDLGLEGEDISNAELLEKFTELIQELKGAKGEEEEKEEPEEEEKEMMDRKEFIKKCMEEGKDLATCSEEFKKKYPMPDKKEEGEAEELAEKKEGEDELAALKLRIAELEKKDELAGVSAKVEELVRDKNLAPVQRDMAIKLAAKLEPEEQQEFLDFFRKTQKFTVTEDVGKIISAKPGEEGSDITPERRDALIKAHGLAGLIDDKADKSKLPWRNN